MLTGSRKPTKAGATALAFFYVTQMTQMVFAGAKKSRLSTHRHTFLDNIDFFIIKRPDSGNK